MRFAAIAVLLGGLSAFAQSEQRDLAGVLPANTRVDQFVITPDQRRTYFVSAEGDAWRYDAETKISDRIAAGPLWDLNLSPKGEALAYTKAGAARGDEAVWAVTINLATGLAAGAPHELSRQGGVPSIAPGGKLVAFARDDANGVGQRIIIVPIDGGAERVAVDSFPSSVGNIRWTPDGKTLYFGVNPPVACVPEWSCLPLAPPLRQPPGSIRRVAVTGGPVTTVTNARNVSPGLSPDGTTLVVMDAGTDRKWIATNADGTNAVPLALGSSQTPTGWLHGSTLILSSGSPPALRTLDLAAARAR